MKHRKREETSMQAEEMIEDIRKRGWARPTIEVINEALTMLGGGGPEQDVTRALLEALIAAAEYWDAAQRKAFEDYLKVKEAGWPDEYRTPEVAWPGEAEEA